MKIIRTASYEEMSGRAAGILTAQVALKPNSVLGLATGSTPIGTYKQMIAAQKAGLVDFSAAVTVNLDEYAGLEPTHDQSYRWFMQQNLLNHINILPQNTHVPQGTAANLDEECARYEALIAGYGGIDMQLLGIGHNGHIGFNEPDDCFAPITHKVSLTQSTINANKRFFESADDVPRQALTMGIGTIMAAKKVLIIASGAEKADILSRAFCGPVTPQVPASILQFHPDVTLVADADALAGFPQ